MQIIDKSIGLQFVMVSLFKTHQLMPDSQHSHLNNFRYDHNRNSSQLTDQIFNFNLTYIAPGQSKYFNKVQIALDIY